MQVEQDIPASVLVRVSLLGPLEVSKRDQSGTWKLVTKDTWKKSRPARSVLKRLLVQPGRRLSREQLADDVWSESSSEPDLYNAISLVRGVIGKPLVKLWGSAYEIAGQALVWTDMDAASSLLKAAENQGYTGLSALPLLEQALAYLERGELLEGEYGTWCYAFRKRAEDMLRQTRLWLAESYETQGKLWQAGEQYRAMVLRDPSDEEALQCWLEMLVRHGKQREALKCYQDMKDFVEEQGFTLSNALEQVVAPLDSSSRAALLSPEKSLQDIISGKMNNLGNQNMRVMLRRQVLQQILGVISLSQVLSFSPLAFEKPTSSIEDYLSQCEENIFACWRLMKGSDITVVQSVLCTWLPPLEHIIRQSNAYRQRSASLAVQGYIIAGLATVLRKDYEGAEWCCKQAIEYSELAEDPNLKVAALKHLATKYNSAKYLLKTLHTYQEALVSVEQASPLLQSRIYLGLALAYAQCGKKSEAFQYWDLTQQSFPDKPEDDPSFLYADCGRSSLNHYGGLIYLTFGQADKAYGIFEEVVQMQQQIAIPERTIIEIVNCKAEAAMMRKNLDLTCTHLQEGVQGAIRLRSEKRFHDSLTLYRQAHALWPHEQPLLELEELFH